MLRAIKRSFTGGEVSPTIEVRDDYAKFASACRKMENFTAQLHGSARFRDGTKFVAELPSSGALKPFVFNTEAEDIYVLVFTDFELRFCQGEGLVEDTGVVVSIVTPYAAADTERIDYTQLGDKVYLAHAGYAFQELARSSHTSWAISAFSAATAIDAPANPTATWSGAAGSTTIEYVIAAVSDAGEISLASAVASVATGQPSSEWVAGNSTSLAWDVVADADEYYIYKSEAGMFGLIGIASTNAFVDQNYVPDTADGPQVSASPFATAYPACVALFQQRLVAGGANSEPRTFHGSQTGFYNNFNHCKPLKDDDAYEHTLASGSVDRITWIMPFGDLLIGTAGAEHLVQGQNGGAVTSNATAKPQSYWGSAAVKPIVVGNSVIHVQRQGSRVRDLFYSLEKDGYAGNDLSLLANHLFDGHTIVSWAYQQEPDSTIWAVRDDGILLGLTYLKEHDIWGWHVHETEGLFKSVCVVPGDGEDRVYFIVDRTVGGLTKHYLEVMVEKWRGDDGIKNAFFVDCGLTYDGAATTTISGLDHLIGLGVVALADGTPVYDLTVSVTGTVTLPFAAELVHVGLPYTGVLAPLPFETGETGNTAQAAMRGFGEVIVRLLDTVGGKVGPTEAKADPLRFTPESYDTPIKPFTGDKPIIMAAATGRDLTVYVVQESPLPMTVRAIVANVEINFPDQQGR